jgi:starch synthase (maltosyl-transferring)
MSRPGTTGWKWSRHEDRDANKIMKIAILTNEYPPNIYGGAGVHVEHLTRELSKLDNGAHTVKVFCFGNQKAARGNLSVEGVNAQYDFPVKDERHKKFLDAMLKNIIISGQLDGVDIVHCHTWYSHFAGMLIKQLLNVPLVLTTHSLEPHRPWKFEQLGTAYNASSWIEKTAYQNADGVIAVSKAMRKDVRDLYGVPSDRIRVIYNGIDLNLYKPVRDKAVLDKYKIDPKIPYILFVGRIARQKGIIHLVNAIKHIKAGHQVVLCAGAPDTKEIAEEMKVRVSKVKKETKNKVIWIEDMVSREESIALYSQAALFVCPSVYEPFGMINIEAMACETPVVATKVGGIPEVVVPGETGLLVPIKPKGANDFEPVEPEKFSQDLAFAINSIIDSPDKLKSMGLRSRQRVVEFFSWKSIAEETLDFYKHLIEKKSAADILGKQRVTIEKVLPEVDNGKYSIKRVPGQRVNVKAHIISDGHDEKAAYLYYCHATDKTWQEIELTLKYNDEWFGDFKIEKEGTYFYTIRSWIDHFKTWQNDLEKKIAVNQDVAVDLLIGVSLIEETLARAQDKDRKKLSGYIEKIKHKGKDGIKAALSKELFEVMKKYSDNTLIAQYHNELEVKVERNRAMFSTWYEIFPRSTSGSSGRHGTFKDCEKLIPEIAGMGFDVLYLPPIHPIGAGNRKGRNNSLKAAASDPGSPWAVGAKVGGHKAIHPQLGTFDDFASLVAKAEKYGMEIALDIAFQCSNDHPYIKEHPEWFLWRPDKTIQYAENPPKKYEDIVPFNFRTDDWKELWEELKSIFIFWAERGVRIFRVDNPHTKPIAFWEWVIAEVKKEYPDALFLAEAFTRPKMMNMLAKIGFSQSYTYFTWRNTKNELVEYINDLTKTAAAEFFRPNFWPNTPDILHEYLQKGGRPAFIIRLVLAGTISSNYGIYGGAYITCQNEPYPGKEEYANNEKYELKNWDLNAVGNIKKEVTLINKIRKENPALQETNNISVRETNNPNILFYVKATEDLSNVIMTVVNVDPHNTHAGLISVPIESLGLSADDYYEVEDLLSKKTFAWQGEWNYVELDPAVTPAHILRVKKIGK